MKRLLFSVSLVFAFGAMCTGGDDAASDEATDVVIVPVPEGDDDDEENWCCEFADEEGNKKFALTDGPAECNSKYKDQEGRWVSGNQCLPCCCKSANDEEDAEAGNSFELTTPGMCAGVGECMAGDAKECKGEDGTDKAAPRPRPKPQPGASRDGGTRGPKHKRP